MFPQDRLTQETILHPHQYKPANAKTQAQCNSSTNQHDLQRLEPCQLKIIPLREDRRTSTVDMPNPKNTKKTKSNIATSAQINQNHRPLGQMRHQGEPTSAPPAQKSGACNLLWIPAPMPQHH